MDINNIFEASLNNLSNRAKEESEDVYQEKPEIDSKEELDNVLSSLPSKETTFSTMAYDSFMKGELGSLGKTKDNEKYRNYGITPNSWENLDKQLADAQSNWAKLGNGLAQAVVSEIGLGTIGATADIFDYIIKNILHLSDEDYSNPVSDTIKEWQDYFNNEIATIYVDPSLNIQNGGLTDFGWYCKNIPNIASTLMLLLPAKGFSIAASKLIKGSELAKGIGNARRWATRINKLEDASQMNRIQTSLNSFEGVARANKAIETSAEALLMRTAENYQEARETSETIYKEASDIFNKMETNQFSFWIDNNKDLFENENINTNDKDEVAKFIARKAADRTFAMDFSNIIFDIIQLHGLKNMGKGIKEIKQTRRIRKLQNQSIEEAGNIKPLSSVEAGTQAATTEATEISEGFIDKLGAYGKKAGLGIYDIGKYQAKTILEESTEGIEEAVNYIAQQEGITYGKMLLAGQRDSYTNSYFTAIPKTWTEMHGSLSDYLKSPELQESAFWGVLGGVAFGNIGGVVNAGQLALERKAEEKKRKENPITGESIPKSSLTELFEDTETRVARITIQKRETLWNDLVNKLKTIENGRDPYSSIDSNNRHLEFQGDKEAKAAIAKARAISEFRSELAIDAVNSGTYELLTEYLKSDEVKNAMVNLGFSTKEEIEQFTQETLNDMEDAKNEYARQSAHVLSQVSFINNTKRKYKDEDENISDSESDISIEYARIIAKDNYIRARVIKAIDKQMSTIGILESEQRKILEESGLNIDVNKAKEAVSLGALLSTYQKLSVEEKEVEARNPTNAIGRLEKFNKLREIKDQKANILKGLSQQTFGSTNTKLANVYNAIAIGKRTIRNVNTGKYEESLEVTDKEILKDVRTFFGDEIKDISDESIIQQAKAINKELNQLINANDKTSIVNANHKLFELFVTSSQLSLQKVMQQSLMSNTVSQIKDRINFYHNYQNEIRKEKITFAEDIITRAIDEYNGIKDENSGQDLIQSIIEAYNGNIQNARTIAEKVMASPGEGAVTASEFIDALNILSLHRKSNESIMDWIQMHLETKNRLSQQTRVNNTNSQNSNTANNNLNQSNSSINQQNSNTSQINGQNQQIPVQTTGQQQPNQQTNPNDSRPVRHVQLIINNRGNISSIKLKNTPNSNTVPVRINNDGTFEIDTNQISKNKILTLISTGLFDVDSNVDLLAEGNTWQITENPILKVRNNNPYQIIKKGVIENINNQETPQQTEQTQQSEPTVTNNIEEESTATPEPTVNNTNFNTSSSSSPVEEITANNNPVTGEQVKSSNEDSSFDNAVLNEVVSFIPDLRATDINFDEISERVKQNLKTKYPSISNEQIDNAVNAQINNFKAANTSILNMSSSVLQAGANVVYNSKIEDANSFTFSSAFERAAESFLDEYSKILLVKKIDGKQIVRLEDIMRLCLNAYPTSRNDASAFFNIIKNYLLNHEDKYIITDLYKEEHVFDNINKTSKEIINETYSDDELRINIRDIIETNPGDYYFNELDRLKVGDKLQLVVQDDKIIFVSNGVTIGTMSKPIVENDKYYQSNQGWITDVKKDDHGNPVSETMEIFKDLFLGNTISHDELRELLTRLDVTGSNITDEDVDEFINNPLISSIIIEALKRKDKGNINTILKVNKNGDIAYKDALLHLVRLWQYTNIPNNSTSKESIKEDINTHLYSWFAKLYNTYNIINNINSNQEVIITKKSGAHAVKITDRDTFNNYNNLSLANEAIADKSITRISVATTNTGLNVNISGKPSISSPGFSAGSTFLTLFGTNTEPDFIKVYGIRFSDSEAIRKSPIFRNMTLAAISYLEEAIQEVIDLGISNNHTVNLEQALRNILAADDYTGSIPLFRAIKGKFQIEPFSLNNGKATGINVVYFEKGKSAVRFKFYNKTSTTNAPFAYTQQNGNALSIAENNKYVIANNAANAFFTFIKDKVNFNIDATGISNDNVNDTNLKGFINRKNGKLVVNIPNNKGNSYNEEFDSYNDFLIDNNLIRVNTKKSKNGTNFERFGENQKLNSILSVSLPINNIITQNEAISSTNLEEFTTQENYDSFVNNFNGEPITGENIFINILSVSDIQKFESVAKEEDLLITDLLPETIEFESKLNDYNKNVKTQPIAITTGGNTRAVYHVYENGNRIPVNGGIKNRVIVGPRFANMAASSIKNRRNNAIKILIHEKIHNILQSQDNKSIDLLKALEEVYNEFVELAKQDINNSELSDNLKKELNRFIQLYKKYESSHKRLITQGKNPNYIHIEEFLVDSLTNGFLYNYLNSKIVNNAKDNGKLENLFTKIVKALAKFFGWTNIKDNSLFMKELNVLRDIYNNSNETINTENIQNNNIVTEEKINNENKIEEIDEQEELEEDEEISFLTDEDKENLVIDELDDANFAVIEDSSNNDDSISIANLDSLRNQLPLNVQLNFTASINRGLYELKCH